MTTRITHKRGDTLSWTCYRGPASARVNLTGYTIAAQLRKDPARTLVADLTVTIDPDQTANTGKYIISALAADTATWLVGNPSVTLYCDVEYTSPGGQVSSTPTFEVYVVEDISQ